jgi:hypothetical protein
MRLAPGLRRETPWNEMDDSTLEARILKHNRRARMDRAFEKANAGRGSASPLGGVAKPSNGRAFDSMLGKAEHLLPALRSGMAARERR